jgi:hypothetical protein
MLCFSTACDRETMTLFSPLSCCYNRRNVTGFTDANDATENDNPAFMASY